MLRPKKSLKEINKELTEKVEVKAEKLATPTIIKRPKTTREDF